MNFKKKLWLSSLLLLVLALVVGCSTAQKAPAGADWQFHTIVNAKFVKQYATVPPPEGVMIIDSRPYKPKYVKGHIPMAINIPGSQFDKMIAKLPQDKSTLLIFYCGGPT